MTGMGKQDALTGHGRGIDCPLFCQPMICRYHGFEWFVVQGLHQNSRLLKRQGDHDDVELSALQHSRQIHRQILLDFQRHFRRPLVQERHEIRQQIRAYCRNGAEP